MPPKCDVRSALSMSSFYSVQANRPVANVICFA